MHGLVGLAAGGEDEERPGIVHRLDRDTSGLLVVARSEEAYARLQELVRERELERRYKAVVRGRPRSWTGRIEAPIGRDRREPTRHSLDTDTPREAITHFEVERLVRPARAARRPARDRPHRTRSASTWRRSTCRSWAIRSTASPNQQLRRQFLHAWRLAFPHPLSGERVEVESPLPPDLQAALARFDS